MCTLMLCTAPFLVECSSSCKTILGRKRLGLVLHFILVLHFSNQVCWEICFSPLGYLNFICKLKIKWDEKSYFKMIDLPLASPAHSLKSQCSSHDLQKDMNNFWLHHNSVLDCSKLMLFI